MASLINTDIFSWDKSLKGKGRDLKKKLIQLYTGRYGQYYTTTDWQLQCEMKT